MTPNSYPHPHPHPHPHPSHGINRTPVKYVVLAGTIREFYNWQHQHGIKVEETFFVSHPQILMGKQWSADVEFVVVGTFTERKDAQEILTVLRTQHPDAHFVNA